MKNFSVRSAKVDFDVVFVPQKRKYKWEIKVELPVLGLELDPLFVNPNVKILGERLHPDWGFRYDSSSGRFYFLESRARFSTPEQAYRDGIKIAEETVETLKKVVAQNSAASQAAENYKKTWEIKNE